MLNIQIIANVIRFDGYDVAQIDPNLPATVRQRFEDELDAANTIEERLQSMEEFAGDEYDRGYDTGSREGYDEGVEVGYAKAKMDDDELS